MKCNAGTPEPVSYTHLIELVVSTGVEDVLVLFCADAANRVEAHVGTVELRDCLLYTSGLGRGRNLQRGAVTVVIPQAHKVLIAKLIRIDIKMCIRDRL